MHSNMESTLDLIFRYRSENVNSEVIFVYLLQKNIETSNSYAHIVYLIAWN